MRLDLYGSVATSEATEQGTLNSKKSVGAQGPGAYTTSTEDKTTLSSSSDAVASLTQIALLPVSSRAEKVAALKEAVSNAEYKLNSVLIADALASADV